MTTLPMPTVEELVQVFRDNGWIPCPGSSGTMPKNIAQGLCCAMPALIALHRPLDLCRVTDSNEVWTLVSLMYGDYAANIWQGFDYPNENTEACLARLSLSEQHKKWRLLGSQLRRALHSLEQ